MSGIYIHVPFCKSKCTYCDFASFPKEIGKTESYFACLYREIEGRGRQLKDKTFSTVYIGGGTPSVVPSKFIAGAIRQVKKFFNLTPNAEITIEINPGTVDADKIKEYKSVGINRFSIGLQTGYDDQLKRLNRVHTAKDFLLCMNLLKGENVSADVLLGLADQTLEQVLKTAELAIAGGVKHISAYALTPEVGTPIYTDYLNGELPSGDEVADLYDGLKEYLKRKGFNRYEVSNFALDGFESKHNLNYWMRGEYIGLGVSASSFIDGRRFTNTFSIDEYMNAIIYNKSPEISSDVIEGDDAEFEFIMLALRTRYGIDLAEFKKQFGVDLKEKYKDVLALKAEYINVTDKNITIKDDYLYVQNDIIMAFLRD
ncbi:MAG: radical SAM family heme chaperone HemW [Clostridia bacterium]|jgi:oxygen-independent coproporphyrinogen-3 oxidase|nr:radical SAM family heme chaperone HemW [Clostridia bacterium]